MADCPYGPQSIYIRRDKTDPFWLTITIATNL